VQEKKDEPPRPILGWSSVSVSPVSFPVEPAAESSVMFLIESMILALLRK
jgi:hypothetical protein